MSDHELYPIGDAARRSGLSVSAVRFYADAGLVEPTGLNGAGHRMYDIDAIARLELVRTLRELDTGLDEIRRLLEGDTTLHGLLTTHLGIVERQERTLRARRAVLRALIKQGGGTPAQAGLMHKLVSMTDEEREQTIDDFWHDVGEDLDVPEGFVDRLRTMRPVLPADPTAAQLEAWIELADLVTDPGFRDAVRAYLQDAYSTPEARVLATDPFQDFIHVTGAPLMEELLAAYRAGEPPRSPRAQQAVTRFMEAATALSGTPLTPEVRNRMADGYRRIPGILRRLAQDEATSGGPVYDDTHGRYLSLVARINGTAPEDHHDPLPCAWIADAMRDAGPPHPRRPGTEAAGATVITDPPPANGR
ncbi:MULTISPECIES: MerR family transcriptional regulator [Streptomyces]|uniref:MerR family transcriptional regulator n=1 Tax=Streptomyces xinghaiensis TaxID=1038928 RepID=A0A3R7HCK7_9ACTN|nr:MULTISPECIES: MerR family transcriptional regulator [Streptomyces]PQM21282.1 MerR family DNA-binding transcriptional regulator [Streptomyces xinghaiensis]RKM93649.1 MerR family transcriptional regulator [Streptomyces xinghaiensis]